MRLVEAQVSSESRQLGMVFGTDDRSGPIRFRSLGVTSNRQRVRRKVAMVFWSKARLLSLRLVGSFSESLHSSYLAKDCVDSPRKEQESVNFQLSGL